MNPSPSTPVRLTTIDGKEREFLLTMGGLRRIKARMKVDSIGSVLAMDAEASGVPVLYEALRDKDGLSEEAFADLLPANLEETVRVIGRLLGASFPDERPTPAEPTPTLQ